MKKRHQSTSQESSAHPVLINYLALIHAVTHPDSDKRSHAVKHHRSPKAATMAVG